VRRKPFAVVLFDESRRPRDIFNSLLQILETAG